MAESAPKSDEIKKEQAGRLRLRYLDFVAVAAAQAVACLAGIYDFAKEKAGPLKPGVQSAESTVKAVLGPVVDKFHDVPFEVLKFVDRKVEDARQEVDRHVPALVKQAAAGADSAARSIAAEVQRSGLVATALNGAWVVVTRYEPVAKEMYGKYEPVAEKYAVLAWRSLNRLPLFPRVAQIAVPTAAYLSQKYNGVIVYVADKGYPVAAYLPLVPIEKIRKVFGNDPGSPEANSKVPVE